MRHTHNNFAFFFPLLALLRLHFWQESCKDKGSESKAQSDALYTRKLNEDICQPDENIASSRTPHPAHIQIHMQS